LVRLGVKMREGREVQGGDIDYGVPDHLISSPCNGFLSFQATHKDHSHVFINLQYI
jgi:ribosomal protein L27